MTAALTQPPAPLLIDAVTRRDDFSLALDLEVEPGQVLGVVGPNGSGKTTLLRVISGLTRVTAGRVCLGERVLDDAATGGFVPPEHRPVSLVFQDYRLFPHLDVVDNVAFPLRSRGIKRAAARAAARPLLSRLDLAHLGGHRPSQLSGGQAQRVALARALAASPQVLMLDEPLAALDAHARLDVRAGLRQHLSDFDGVCLLVTHDPLEALILADRLVVLEAGRVTQQGPPAAVARRPASPYVASLVGLNLYRGQAAGDGTVVLERGERLVVPTPFPAGPVLLTVRPSAIAIYLEQPHLGSPRNTWRGVISSIELLTDRVRVHVDGRPSAFADVTPAAVAELRLERGSEVWLAVKSNEIDVYPQGGSEQPSAVI